MRLFLFLATAFSFSVFSESASAKQYVRHVHGREVVVHTNPVPVVLHRMVPPQYGRHVTERAIQNGKLPTANRSGLLGNLSGR
jgi:hypothetical protein